MDEIDNPYQPGAGTPPPALAGRSDLLRSVAVMLGRLNQGRYAKSLIPTGLRGVGKTVLLNRFADEADKLAFHTIIIEATDGGQLADHLIGKLRQICSSLIGTSRLDTLPNLRFEFSKVSVSHSAAKG